MRRVSVVIPAYNYARYLGEAIESALTQTHPPLEVIVVDDGSTDATPSVIASFGDRVLGTRQLNAGVSAASNAGAALAQGEMLAFLDADDAWLPTKLQRQVEALIADPALGLVHCGVEEMDAEGRTIASRLDGLEGWVSEEMLLFRRSVILGGGSGFLCPAALFRELSGFDPALSISHDWDLFFRIARRRPVAFVREPLLRYRVHGANMHANVATMEADMLRAYAKAFVDPGLSHLRGQAYGSLHLMLAGSYYRSGRMATAVGHAVRAVSGYPPTMFRLLDFPGRVVRRTRVRWAAKQ